MIDSYVAFMMMYYILDAAAEELVSKEVVDYASRANPFLFKDEGSADPAMYTEFSEAWNSKFKDRKDISPEECKIFIKNYLKGLSSECLEAFNLVVDDSSWQENLKDIQEQAQNRRETLS